MNTEILAETSFRGIAISHKTLPSDDGFMSQVVIKNDFDFILCIWKHKREANDFTLGQKYVVVGQVRERAGKQFMLQPHIELASDTIIPTIVGEPKMQHKSGTKRFLKSVLTTAGLLVLLSVVGVAHENAAVQSNTATTDSLDTSTTYEDTADDLYDSDAAVASTVSLDDLDFDMPSYSSTPNTPVYTPYDCDYQAIPYSKKTKTSSLISLGQSRITAYGINGSKKVCYPHGRDSLPTTSVVYQPIDEVTSIGTYVAPDYSSSYSSSLYDYSGYYNVDGNYVPSPSYTGSTIGGYSPSATCRDGTYSYSQNRSGTCSGHGGVSSW